jgi:hypothetical protein
MATLLVIGNYSAPWTKTRDLKPRIAILTDLSAALMNLENLTSLMRSYQGVVRTAAGLAREIA